MAAADPSSAFDLGPELDAAIARAAERIAGAGHVVAMTGAGLSVESGIPPFRGKGGLWTKYGEPPLDGFQRFLADPRRAWQERLSPREPWLVGLVETLSKARPNAGHRALASLERAGHCACLITQNIDDLHRQAGQQALLEIHGNHRLLRCIDCVTRFEPGELPVDPHDLPPRCPHCGGLVKGDTVSFGEPIPPDVLRRCYEEVEASECMIVAGTSASVYPAAEFPYHVLHAGGTVIEVNPEPTDLTGLATLSLAGPGGAVLGRLLERVLAISPERAAS